MAARTTKDEKYQRSNLTCGAFRGIAVRAHVGAPPAKVRHVILAPGMSSRIDYGAHNNDAPNLVRALNERVFNVQSAGGLAPTPLPLPGVWKSLAPVAKRIVKSITHLPLERLTCKQFIEQCPNNKKMLYARAAQRYRERGWIVRDARIKAFVKFEKTNFTKKKDPAPRVIQPRTPVYNLALGLYTRRVESCIYKALALEWGGDDEGVVMKGRTVVEVAAVLRAKWERVKRPVAIGIDASRFDQHVSRDALKWEHSVYKRLFGYDGELIALLNQQLKNKGRSDIDGYRVEYEVHGTRASGDMNTSLGNCLIMCTLVREYIRELGIKAEFVNNGDDCVLFVSEGDVPKLDGLNAWFLKYGFEMEREEPVRVFEKVVFCQMQPVYSGSEWVMVRQPSSAFAKDAIALGESTRADYRRWAYQVGVGGHALYGDMPIYSAYYEAYRRNGQDSKLGNKYCVSDSGFLRLSKIPRIRSGDRVEVTQACRVSFYSAFGYPPSMQIAMEKELATFVVGDCSTSTVNPAVSMGLTTI